MLLSATVGWMTNLSVAPAPHQLVAIVSDSNNAITNSSLKSILSTLLVVVTNLLNLLNDENFLDPNAGKDVACFDGIKISLCGHPNK